MNGQSPMILHCSSVRPEAPEGGMGRIRIGRTIVSAVYQYFYVASLLSISLCAFCKHSLNWLGTACAQFLIGFVIARAWGEIGQPKPGATGCVACYASELGLLRIFAGSDVNFDVQAGKTCAIEADAKGVLGVPPESAAFER
jgi:hypothetical protein